MSVDPRAIADETGVPEEDVLAVLDALGEVDTDANGGDEDTDRERDYLKSFGKYADTNIGEAVEQVHEELGDGFEERDRDLFGQ
jgi:hypothetical protein